MRRLPRDRARHLMLPVVLLWSAAALSQADGREWTTLAEDGNHDPASPAIELKQEPAEALLELPPDSAGNKVAWVKALQQGVITPRAKLYPSTEVKVIDLDILFIDTAQMPFVLFPHRRHSEWLDCSNCHGPIFRDEAGTTPINMFSVLMGEHCGRCHGAVSFPLTECSRCHSVEKDFEILKRNEREQQLENLSPYQDSTRVVLAKPRTYFEQQQAGQAK